MMRVLAALFVSLAFGIFAFAAIAGLTSSVVVAGMVAVPVAGFVGWLIFRRKLLPLDGAACSRSLAMTSAVVAALALVQLVRLTVFMVDAEQWTYSFIPSSDWEVRHSCLSAYYVSAQAASTSPDIYDDALFTSPNDDPTKIRTPLRLGMFNIDVFEYPPPFLLLPRALMLVTPDFLRLRTLWFGITGAVFLFATTAVARFMSPAAGTRAVLLSPFIWLSAPTLSVLQKGNVQIVVIALGVLAMMLFDRRRWAAGGGVLAFITLSKLYPGLLVAFLAARRQWRALGWTAAFGIAFVCLSLVDTGWGPYSAFMERLPLLFSGEAFPAFRNPAGIAVNYSIPGIAFKLGLFGVPGMGFGAAKILGWLYTPIALAATIVAGLRILNDDEKPLVWIAILILATLRSPFLPQAYAGLPPLWLLTLLAATRPVTGRVLALVVLGWAALNIYWPVEWPMDPRVRALEVAVPQALTIALAVLALRRPRP